jgi:hypothetical protein
VFSNYTLASFAQYYQNSWDWQTNWGIADITLQAGLNTITLVAEDIKGLKTAEILNATLTPTLPVPGTIPSDPSNPLVSP